MEAKNETLKLILEYEKICLQVEHLPTDAMIEKMTALSQQIDEAGAWGIEALAKPALVKLGISDLAAKMKSLSGGQRKRVALAHALVVPSELLILVEPTNHLDAESTDWLEFDGLRLHVFALDRVAYAERSKATSVS